LIYKAEKGERKYLEKKIRKKVDAFKSHLRHLKPAINVTDKWEDVRDSAGGVEFDALDEDARKESFDRVIKRLEEKVDESSKKRTRSMSKDSTMEEVDSFQNELKRKKSEALSEGEEEGELLE
jgi:hypothetical protein